MVKSISVALGEPNLYTNALVNECLPFVVEWDAMSEEGQAEMVRYWSPKEVGRRAFRDKTGCFAAEYDNVRREWCVKGGTECYTRGHGCFDEEYDDVRREWCVKGGTECFERGNGLWDPAHAKVKQDGRVAGGVATTAMNVALRGGENGRKMAAWEEYFPTLAAFVEEVSFKIVPLFDPPVFSN